MVKMKKEFIDLLKMATHPIQLTHFFKSKQLPKVIPILTELISEGTLQGILTRNNRFLPLPYLEEEITTLIETNGKLDMVELVRQFQPINTQRFIEIVRFILNKTSDNIFWDLELRKCYLVENAANDLRLFLKRLEIKRRIRWDHLIREIKWPEELIEICLDVLAKRDQFIGVLEGNILYTLKGIKDELQEGNENAFSIFKQILLKIHEDYQKIPVSWIIKLFQIEKDEIYDIIRKAWDCNVVIPFIFTEDQQNLRFIVDIIKETLIVIFSYRRIPIEFLKLKLELTVDDLQHVLHLVKQITPLILVKDNEISSKSPEEIISNALILPRELMKIVSKERLLYLYVSFIKEHGYLPVVVNEDTIKGIKTFSIYCQICNDSYENPNIFYECMNCQRQTCKQCYERQPQRSCAYCENISSFILDLPRFCSNCEVTYLSSNSFNEDTERCIFCNSQLLQSHDNLPLSQERGTPMKGKILSIYQYLAQQTTPTIPLKSLISQLGCNDEEIVYYLENMIAFGKIKGYINVQEASFHSDLLSSDISCIQCEKLIPKDDVISCSTKKHHLCKDCYDNLLLVGFDACPECNQSLLMNK